MRVQFRSFGFAFTQVKSFALMESACMFSFFGFAFTQVKSFARMESACVFSFGLLVLQADSISEKLFTRTNAFMLIYFLTFNIYKYAFLIYTFDNDDMKSCHVVLLSLIFLLKCLS